MTQLIRGQFVIALFHFIPKVFQCFVGRDLWTARDRQARTSRSSLDRPEPEKIEIQPHQEKLKFQNL